MSGRLKQKVYEYSTLGKYIRDYESISEYRDIYFSQDIGKRPIFQHNELGIDYHIFDEIIILKERPGREIIKLLYFIHNSKYCNTGVDRPVQVFNLKNELIAEFKNTVLLLKLMPDLNKVTLSNQLNRKTNNPHKSRKLGLTFKYK